MHLYLYMITPQEHNEKKDPYLNQGLLKNDSSCLIEIIMIDTSSNIAAFFMPRVNYALNVYQYTATRNRFLTLIYQDL